MPSSFCSVCHKHLRNPLSVKLGIGPVCRARDNQQRVFDFMHAQTGLLRHERGKYIFVRDIGHNSGRSVTNNIDGNIQYPDKITPEEYEEKIKGTVPEELADAIIRIADIAGIYKIDLNWHVVAKMRYNCQRPYLHGKRYG
ncbi:hypothetical protein FACS1894151_07530 [Spirochaetia bacterium]|nr:hypothetical protein FACS1894151_07530 [Spirochaetia bacterium]